MPLSDRERQILSDIESRLREEDPKFAKTVSTSAETGGSRRKVKLAIAGFVLGFVLLLAVVPAQTIWLGVAGFAVMLASLVYGGAQLRRFGDDGDAFGGQLRSGLERFLHRGGESDAAPDS